MGFRKGCLIRLACGLCLVAGLRGPQRPACPAAVAAATSGIVVEGNKRVDAETVRSYFHGHRIEAKINQAVQARSTGPAYFSDVRVSSQAGGRSSLCTWSRTA